MMHRSGCRIRLRFQWQRWQCLIRWCRIVDSCGGRIVRVLIAQRVGEFVAVRRCWMQIGECFVTVCDRCGGRLTRRHTAGRCHCIVIVHARIGAVRGHKICEWVGLLCVAVQQKLIVERRLTAGRCGQRAGRRTICKYQT